MHAQNHFPVEGNTNVQVRPTMTVAELVEVAPQVVRFFMERRLHCVGCHLDTFCTLEQVAAFYGQPDLVQALQTFLNRSDQPPTSEDN